MAIVGIIAEYNPFHNGHAYQIEQARQITACESLIVAMSGDFVQRGTPAVIDKEIRTIAALQSGADMVLQIPVAYSTASAEAFAYGGVSLLVAAGIDTLVFGCEDPSLDMLQALAELYANEPKDYKEKLQHYLKEGMSFPVARSNATVDVLSGEKYCLAQIQEILKKPNNILAIEYLKALKRLKKEGILTNEVQLCPILRIGTDYHSLDTADNICSATALREMIYTDKNNHWMNFVPDHVHQAMMSYFLENTPLCEDNFSNELQYCFLQKKKYGFFQYADGNEEISNRLINRLDSYDTFSSFCKQLQTKDITYARVSRFLLHILLDITENKMQLLKKTPVPYIRVLGFHKNKSHLLSYIADLQRAPLLANIKSAKDLLSPEALILLDADLFARDLYLTKINGQTDFQFPTILK